MYERNIKRASFALSIVLNLALVLTTMNVKAADPTWATDGYQYDGNGGAAFATIIATGIGPVFAIGVADDSCAAKSATRHRVASLKIEGQFIKAESRCVFAGMSYITPATAAGNNIINNRFTVNPTVTIVQGTDTYEFSTTGYRKVWIESNIELGGI